MKSYGKITVDSINPKGLKGMPEAQIRQVVTTSLPSTRTTNNIKGSLFTDDELGIKSNDFDEIRVAWIPVRAKDTVETVQAALDASPIKKLVRFLSSAIILSDDQISVVKNGLRNTETSKALDSFNEKYGIPVGTAWGPDHLKFFLNAVATRQLVRKGGDGVDKDEAVLFNGKQQYRRVEFPPVPMEDVDHRTVVELREVEELDLAPTAKAEQITVK